VTLCVSLAAIWAQTDQTTPDSRDAVVRAQEPAPAQIKRPEQKKAHNRSDKGMTWDQLASMSPDAIRQQGIIPYPDLPHLLQANGGQMFPAIQIEMFPRLERFEVEFDIPDTFLPEFPPAIE
jgi:hypothetical protein